jgi:hypothetical protein
MARTFHWVATITLAAGMTTLAQSQEPAPAPEPTQAPAPSAPAPSGKGQKMTVQGCLQSGTGMRGSSTGIASPIITPGSTPTSTTESGPIPAVKSDTIYMLRATDASGANRTGMPSATAGQMDERAAAGAQGGTVYRVVADDATILAAHVNHQIEIEGRVQPAGNVPPPAGPSGTSADQAIAGADVLTVGKVRMIAEKCQ